MGSDKAFLFHEGERFISRVVLEASKVSDEVIVMVGKKRKEDYEAVLGKGARVFKDNHYIANPIGGILSALDHVKHTSMAVLACDAPLVKAEVISYLFAVLKDHSAAVPIWEEGDKMTIEPLCAVYNVEKARKAITQTLHERMAGPKRMVFRMKDVFYLSVTQLRLIDPMLDSLVNINTKEEYSALESRETRSTAIHFKSSMG